MTTDFLVDLSRNGWVCQEACSVKPSSELQKKRVLEKLEIKRRFWAEQKIPLRIFTEREFSPTITKNLQWIRMLSFENQSEPWEGFHQTQADAVLNAIPGASQMELRQFCDTMDKELSLETGSTLGLMRYLLSQKKASVDISKPLNDHRSMADFLLRNEAVGREIAWCPYIYPTSYFGGRKTIVLSVFYGLIIQAMSFM